MYIARTVSDSEIFSIKRRDLEIWVRGHEPHSDFFHTPPAFDDTFRGPRRNIAMIFGVKNNQNGVATRLRKYFITCFTQFTILDSVGTCMQRNNG